MELFLLEHKKLWRKTSTKISVFLCFLYLVVFGSILSFQSLTGLIPRSLLRFTKMPSEARSRLIPRSLLRGSLLVQFWKF